MRGVSTTHPAPTPRFVPWSELHLFETAPNPPGLMVRNGQVGTWWPRRDSLSGGTFVPAPQLVQLAYGLVTGMVDARRHLDHMAQHDPDVEPF